MPINLGHHGQGWPSFILLHVWVMPCVAFCVSLTPISPHCSLPLSWATLEGLQFQALFRGLDTAYSDQSWSGVLKGIWGSLAWLMSGIFCPTPIPDTRWPQTVMVPPSSQQRSLHGILQLLCCYCWFSWRDPCPGSRKEKKQKKGRGKTGSQSRATANIWEPKQLLPHIPWQIRRAQSKNNSILCTYLSLPQRPSLYVALTHGQTSGAEEAQKHAAALHFFSGQKFCSSTSAKPGILLTLNRTKCLRPGVKWERHWLLQGSLFK